MVDGYSVILRCNYIDPSLVPQVYKIVFNKLLEILTMSFNLRKEVLKAFKGLHRARTAVFEGDENALHLMRAKINEEFQKNKHVEDKSKISEMIQLAKDVETELRTTVVQAREVEPQKYEVRFREETVRMENYPYQDVPEEILMANMKKAGKKCGDRGKTVT